MEILETTKAVEGFDMAKKLKIIQVRNPRTDRYVKIDREAGKILEHKKTPGPFKDGTPYSRNKNKASKKELNVIYIIAGE